MAAAKAAGQAPRFIDALVRSLGAPVRTKISQAIFGPEFGYHISGGAKLPVLTAWMYHSLGIMVVEGYGLTETCVATHVNRPGKAIIGTVGPPLADDIDVGIAEDGEILMRGPNVTSGYFNRPQATMESWDPEGWFHTGDLGSIGKGGFLTITGRKKELIITTTGKKIPPDRIEELLRTIPGVAHAIACGDGEKHISALLSNSRF
jgi:long-chain acyl-CoA synthetase